MGASRPNPERPLFLAPSERKEPQDGRCEDSGDRCALAGCDAPLPHFPGNEETTRYCCREHRREGRAQRSRARHSGER